MGEPRFYKSLSTFKGADVEWGLVPITTRPRTRINPPVSQRPLRQEIRKQPTSCLLRMKATEGDVRDGYFTPQEVARRSHRND
jgi:hypothetical protein